MDLRSRAVSNVLLVVLLLFFLVRAAVWANDAEIRRTGPDPSRASPFLQNYSPQPVVHAFAFERFNSWVSEGKAAGGGADSVRNDRQFRAGFAGCRDGRATLAAALDQDLVTQLRLNKATLLLHTGSPQTGIHMVYRLNRTLGVVDLEPVKPDLGMRRVTALPAPLEDVIADVTVSETWFRTDKAASNALRQPRRF